LLPLIPIISISIGSIITKFPKSILLKVSIICLTVIGFVVNLLGNLVWYWFIFLYGRQEEKLHKLFSLEESYNIGTWDPAYSLVSQLIKILSSDFVGTLTLKDDPLYLIGLTGCNFDIYLFCNFGILPIILLGIIILIIGLVILKILKRKDPFPLENIS